MKPKHTAYLLLTIALLLVTPVVIKLLFPSEPNPDLDKKFEAQKNPFTVCNDSAAVVWLRASEFLDSRKGLLTSGDRVQNDSVIYVPYSNAYHKGISLKIERKKVGDSTTITVNVWETDQPEPLIAKEIALFMATRFDKYDH
jgi:hypothetical protein